jgi:hypothetical protein
MNAAFETIGTGDSAMRVGWHVVAYGWLAVP